MNAERMESIEIVIRAEKSQMPSNFKGGRNVKVGEPLETGSLTLKNRCYFCYKASAQLVLTRVGSYARAKVCEECLKERKFKLLVHPEKV